MEDRVYYTRGEVAKRFNITVKTLRHYEEKGLLYPAFVDENNGYHYYSVNQFIDLDLIKLFRKMGMPVDEIKVQLLKTQSLNGFYEVIGQLESVLDLKMQELLQIKDYLKGIQRNINDAAKQKIGVPVVIYRNRRKVTRFSSKNSEDEQSVSLFRTSKIYVESTYNDIYPVLSGCVPYQEAVKGEIPLKYLIYMHRTNREGTYEENCQSQEIPFGKSTILAEELFLDAGNYLVIHFDEEWRFLHPYYEQLVKYVEDHGLEVGENIYDAWVVPRSNPGGETRICGYLEIFIKGDKP